MDKRLLIFAGSYQQALQCAQERGLQPTQFLYASDRWRLAGLNPDGRVHATYGSWKKNEEVVEAFEYWTTRPNAMTTEPMING